MLFITPVGKDGTRASVDRAPIPLRDVTLALFPQSNLAYDQFAEQYLKWPKWKFV
jgi:hypothetical protein